jgi:hypothetical protein
LLEDAFAVRDGAGKRALSMTEQLALDQARSQCGAIDGNEGLAGSRALGVQRTRDELLARAALAADERGSVGLGNVLARAEHVEHRLRAAAQAVEGLQRSDAASGSARFDLRRSQHFDGAGERAVRVPERAAPFADFELGPVRSEDRKGHVGDLAVLVDAASANAGRAAVRFQAVLAENFVGLETEQLCRSFAPEHHVTVLVDDENRRVVQQFSELGECVGGAYAVQPGRDGEFVCHTAS